MATTFKATPLAKVATANSGYSYVIYVFLVLAVSTVCKT